MEYLDEITQQPVRTEWRLLIEEGLLDITAIDGPVWLLSDFIQILHPDKKPQSPLRYYQKLNE